MIRLRKAILAHTCLKRLVLASAAAGVFALQSQAGVIINYPDFSSTAGLTFAGSTTTTANQLELTAAAIGESGAAYSTTAVTLGASDTFSTTFEFQFTNTGGIDPADGITFVLAQSPTGLGIGGGGLGYLGVNNSVAIEFDTYENGGVDSCSNHVAIDTNGALSNSNLTNLYGVATCDTGTHTAAGCMSNGDVWSVTISYDGANLSASAWDTTGEGSAFPVYSSVPLNIASFLGGTTAYVGFSGGTGSGFEQQDILNWELANDTSLGSPSTPEPATAALVFAGIAGLALVKRRRACRR